MLSAWVLAAMVSPSPMIIAHRGASAYAFEHTEAAYRLAIRQGADVIEPDVVLTRDNVLLCSHDLTLERTTDVEKKFPDRKRADGKWYVIDFDWQEIATLTVDGPVRSTQVDPKPAKKMTLAAMIDLVRRLGEFGIIPEPKQSAFHRKEGKDLEAALVKLLREKDLNSGESGVTIQSFEEDALKRYRQLGAKMPLVFLVSTSADVARAGGIPAIKRFAEGLGPNKNAALLEDGKMLREAKAAGLKLYPWTFQNEPELMRRFFREFRVDGIFTDFPDVGIRARSESEQGSGAAL